MKTNKFSLAQREERADNVLWPIFTREVRQREEERLENRLEELCVNSPVFVPLFIVIRRRETCSPSNTKYIRKDLLDPKGFLLYLYLGFTQSHIDKHMSQQNQVFQMVQNKIFNSYTLKTRQNISKKLMHLFLLFFFSVVQFEVQYIYQKQNRVSIYIS